MKAELMREDVLIENQRLRTIIYNLIDWIDYESKEALESNDYGYEPEEYTVDVLIGEIGMTKEEIDDLYLKER